MKSTLSTLSLASLLIGLLLVGGCVTESHQLLSDEAIGERIVWSDCDQALNEGGRHMDACTFEEGSGCGNIQPTSEVLGATCVGGDLLLADYDITVPPARNTEPCDGALTLDWGEANTLDVTSAGAGCAAVDLCRYSAPDPSRGVMAEGVRWSIEVCAHAPVEVAAAEETPRVWLDCEGLIQEARDGDPCTAGITCAGYRELGESAVGDGTTYAGPLLSWCDEGHLRVVDLTLASFEG